MNRPRSVAQDLAGWGHHPVEPCLLYRAERVQELRDVVVNATSAKLIARGHGRAYGDASLNRDLGVLSQARFDRFLAFDDASGVLHCESGVSLADIIDEFLPRGWFFPVTPGTKRISLGGAIAADVHGKNHHRDGSLGRFLDSITVMLASGELVICSREAHSDLFFATIGGMGLTGVVVDARLRLARVESAWVKSTTERCGDLDETLDRITRGDAEHAYAVAWIDCLSRGRHLGRSVLLRADPASVDELPASARAHPLEIKAGSNLAVPFAFPALALNPVSLRIFNELYYARNRPSRELVNYESYFYPLDAVGHWNRIYGRRGALQYQVVVPTETAAVGMKTLIERIGRDRRSSFLGVIKSMGMEGEGLLSFPRPGLTLSLDFPYTGPDLIELLHELDDIVLAHGGRVYLAKDACVRAEHIPMMYPRLDAFREVKATVDPDERFSSSLSRRIGITRSDV